MRADSRPHTIFTRTRAVVWLALLLSSTQGCSDSTRADEDNNAAIFEGIALLVTERHEQGLSAPSNGAVALVPMIQYDGSPGPGSNVIVRMVTSAGAVAGGPINLGTNEGDLPLAAFDGTNFLVVYQMTVSGSSNLYGQFFNTSGAATTPSFEITGTDDSPAVWSLTYGAGKYLVTYQRQIGEFFNGAYRFVSPTGTVGTEIIFNDRGGMSASAFDGTRFLIAYARVRTQVMGRTLHPDGTLGAAFTINGSTEASNGGMAVAFGGTNYIVAYTDSTAGWDVYAQAVSPAGTLVGARTSVIAGPGHESPLGMMAADGGNVLLTWVAGDNSSKHRTGATFLNGTGSTVGASVMLFDASQDIAAPITSKLGSSYLAVVSRRATTWDVYGKLMSLSP